LLASFSIDGHIKVAVTNFLKQTQMASKQTNMSFDFNFIGYLTLHSTAVTWTFLL